LFSFISHRLTPKQDSAPKEKRRFHLFGSKKNKDKSKDEPMRRNSNETHDTLEQSHSDSSKNALKHTSAPMLGDGPPQNSLSADNLQLGSDSPGLSGGDAGAKESPRRARRRRTKERTVSAVSVRVF